MTPGIGAAASTAAVRRDSPGLAPWLDEALRDLDDIRRGSEWDRPIPTRVVTGEAAALLRRLGSTIPDPPSVVGESLDAVGIEFIAESGNRVRFVIESDGSASYLEYISGEFSRWRFPPWPQMMDVIGWRGLERAGVRAPPTGEDPERSVGIPIRSGAENAEE